MANWLFQGNPKRYPVLDHLLEDEQFVGWSVTRYLKELAEGDKAVLWVSGKRAGVYAIGTVLGSPELGPADDEWIDPAERRMQAYFCPLHWEENLVDRPILKVDLLAAGGFDHAQIIRQPWAGNPMILTDEEWWIIDCLR